MADIWIVGVAEAVSVGCAVHMWLRSRRSIAWKVVWTPLVLVPVVGPLFYASMVNPPQVQRENLRAVETDLDMDSELEADFESGSDGGSHRGPEVHSDSHG